MSYGSSYTPGLKKHAPQHELSGSDQLTADKLKINYIPTNYTSIPTIDYTDIRHLSAHLTGIDNALSTLITGSGGVYGTQYHFSSSTDIFSSTSQEFQNVFSFTTNPIAGGKYKISWLYIWNYDDIESSIETKILLDNTIDLLQGNNIITEPGDVGGKGKGGSRQKYVSSGFAVENLTSGIHIIDIKMRSGRQYKCASIFTTRVELYRVY